MKKFKFPELLILGKRRELKQRRKKISFLLVVPYTIPEYSGSGMNAFNFARFLTIEGIKVTLLTFNRNMKYLRKEWIDNFLIRRILYFNLNLVSKILSLVFIIPVYIFYVARNKIILIYGGHIIGYELILLFARWFGRKTIFQSLLIDADDIETIILSKPEFLKKFYKKLFSRVDIYHSINSNFSSRFGNVLRKTDSILEMPQGVDIRVFNPASDDIRNFTRDQLGIPVKSWVMLSVGFMIPRKGFSGIFDVLKDLDIPYTYIIAGEFDFPKGHFLHPYERSSSELIQKGKELLGDKLILAGPVRDIQKYYQIADIVLFNSLQEGLPNSLLEAMSCGIPVVTRNIPGLEGFILNNNRNCFIFNDEIELKDRIHYLYKNKSKASKISSTSIQEIQQKASFQNVLSAYYQRLFTTGIEPEKTA